MRNMRSFHGFLLILFTICIPNVVHAKPAKTPTANGYGGAVATISAPASQAALTILNRGGNAIDAAIAAAAVLGVTDPFSCGIGGGGFMMIYYAKDKRIISIDSRETAPTLATPSMFLEWDGTAMENAKAIGSGLSVGVPGAVRGWHEALERFGTRTLADVLAPAIEVASRGFIIDENFHRLAETNEKKFAQFTTSSALYLTNGRALPIGTLFKNKDLARAYKEIARSGVRYFYEDKPARAMVAAVQKPPTVKGVSITPGSLTLADLANYETRLRLPVHSTYRGYDIYGMNLPSSGGISIALALNILEGYDLRSMTPDAVKHLYLEASRLAFADRNAYLADPEFTIAPVKGLLNKAYAAKRRTLINPKRALSTAASYGNPCLFQTPHASTHCPPLSSSVALRQESAHTTHLTVADREGNIVAYTYTIEDWGGSGIVVPGYGFLLNNEMTDFDFKASTPNLPAPGKRPRSSMSPTFVFKDGKPIISLGSPGGSSIITTVLETLVNHFDLGMPLDEALAAPRMSQRNAPTTFIEPGYLESPAAKALKERGHVWNETQKEIGAANALFFGNNGKVTAISEPRRHGMGSALVQSAHPQIYKSAAATKR